MKMPHIKFFCRDWQGDAGLRMCGYAARGLWIELMCCMAQGEPYGHLTMPDGSPVTPPHIATLTGGDKGVVEGLLAELEKARVFSRTEQGVIYSRRMVKDYERMIFGKETGRLGGNPKLKPRHKNPKIQIPDNQNPDTRSQNPLSISPPVNPPKGAVAIPASLSQIEGFSTEWANWIENRRAMRKPATPRSQEIILATLAERPGMAVAALQEAIMRNWMGFKWDWYDAEARRNGKATPNNRAVLGRPAASEY